MPVEALEAAVGVVVEVAPATRRRVGRDDVDASVELRLESRSDDAPGHVLLRVHVGPLLVPERPAEAHDPEAVEVIDLAVDVAASQGRSLVVDSVVVAPHVEEGHVEHRLDELEIARVEVAAGDDEVDALHPRAVEAVGEVRLLVVGDGEESS
jgi:hypothetical protein